MGHPLPLQPAAQWMADPASQLPELTQADVAAQGCLAALRGRCSRSCEDDANTLWLSGCSSVGAEMSPPSERQQACVEEAGELSAAWLGLSRGPYPVFGQAESCQRPLRP